MLWIFALMILVVNEYSSGEKWFGGVLKGFAALSILFTIGVFFTGQLLVLSIFALAGVTAVELYEKDCAKQAAKKRFDDVTAELNKQPLVFTQRIDEENAEEHSTVA